MRKPVFSMTAGSRPSPIKWVTAALLAAAMLATSDEALAARLDAWRAKQTAHLGAGLEQVLALEVVLLAFALAYRIRYIRRQIAEQTMLHEQQTREHAPELFNCPDRQWMDCTEFAK